MAINNIINDSWQGHSHGEVEQALKDKIQEIEQAMEELSPGDTIGYNQLSSEVKQLLTRAQNALQSTDIAAWAKAANKPSYNANEIVGVDGYANLLAKLQAMDTAIAAAAESGGDVDLDDYYTKSEVGGMISGKVDKVTGKGLSTNDYTDAEKTKLAGLPTNPVTSISVNGQSPQTPSNGNVNLVIEAGGLTEEDIDVSSNQDGTVDFTFGESSYTINLNHTHPQYVVIDELDDYILPGTNVTITKDPQTGALTISALGGGGGISGITMNGTAVTINNGVAELGTVLTSHQSLAGRVQSSDVVQIVVLADEAAYTALATKDSNTIYIIPES